MKQHYVYEITNITNDMKYIGCRSCICEPKEDIGLLYFSCSKDEEFMKEQKEQPDNFEYKVLQVFRTRKEAIQLEIDLHAKHDVGRNEKYYNKAKQTSTGWDTTGCSFPGINKGKIFIYNKAKKQCKSINPNLFEAIKQEGWKKGKKYINTGTCNLIWIKRDNENKCIKEYLLEKFKKEGWVRGRISGTFNSEKHQKTRAENRKRTFWKKYCNETQTNFSRPNKNDKIELYNKKENKFKNVIFKNLGSVTGKLKTGWIFTGKVLSA